MKLLVLSSDSENPSTKALLSAAKLHNLDVEVANPLDVYFEFSSRGSSQTRSRPSARTSTFYAKSKKLSKPDLVLPRLGWKTSMHGLRVAQAFASCGIPVVNSPDSIRKASDKLACLMEFHAASLPHPLTKFAFTEVESKFHLLPPKNKKQVFKLLSGSQGFGVTLAESLPQASAQADSFRNIPTEFFTQEFLAEVKKGDYRAFVIDGKVVAAMKRKPAPGDFRANLHQGGKAFRTELTKKEIQMAEHASQALGLYYAGIDFIRTSKGSLLLEANAFPGFEGISQISRVDVASLLVQSLIEQF